VTGLEDIKQLVIDGEKAIADAQVIIDVLTEAGEDVKQRQSDLNITKKRIEGLKRGLIKAKAGV